MQGSLLMLRPVTRHCHALASFPVASLARVGIWHTVILPFGGSYVLGEQLRSKLSLIALNVYSCEQAAKVRGKVQEI